MTYAATKNFPNTEKFGLSSQMQRAAVSIPSNVAEGYRRHSKADFKRFLYISLGSLSELETQYVIAHRQKFISDNQLQIFQERSQRLTRMMYSFIKSL